MFRLAKPESFMLISPSREDVCLPIILPWGLIVDIFLGLE